MPKTCGAISRRRSATATWRRRRSRRMHDWFEMSRTIVMPAHCDHYGHMNVRHYAALFDDAGWHMFARAGVSLGQLNTRGLGSVVATMTIDFHHEIKAGQLALITGAITRV